MFFGLIATHESNVVTPLGTNTVLDGVTTEELERSIHEMLAGLASKKPT